MRMKRKYDIRIEATFIGRKPSLGFIPGRRYQGWVRHMTFKTDEGLSCPYSVSGFLTFWENIYVMDRNGDETLRRSAYEQGLD